MKKRLISLSLLTTTFTTTLFGASIMPYGAYIKYDNSAKDKAYLGGIYYSKFTSPYKLEADAEMLKIKYVKTSATTKDSITGKTTTTDTTPKDYNEFDLTLVGHYYVGYNYDYKFGIHNIFTDDDYNQVFIGGVLYYKTLKYNYGADVYVGNYKNFQTYQLTPKAGFNFGDYYSQYGSFYAEGKLNIINISKSDKAPKQNYTNIDLKLQNFIGDFTTTLKCSLGKSAYKVASDGFSIYNLGNEYKNSMGVDVSYKLDKISSVKVGLTNSTFTEYDKTAHSYTYLVSYSKSF